MLYLLWAHMKPRRWPMILHHSLPISLPGRLLTLKIVSCPEIVPLIIEIVLLCEGRGSSLLFHKGLRSCSNCILHGSAERMWVRMFGWHRRIKTFWLWHLVHSHISLQQILLHANFKIIISHSILLIVRPICTSRRSLD